MLDGCDHLLARAPVMLVIEEQTYLKGERDREERFQGPIGGWPDSNEVHKSRLGVVSGRGGIGHYGSVSEASLLPKVILSEALESDFVVSSVGLTKERRCVGILGEMVDGLGEDDERVLVGHSSVLSEKMIDSVMGVSFASSNCSGMPEDQTGEVPIVDGQNPSASSVQLASHQQKVAAQNIVATPSFGNLPTVAVMKERVAPGLRLAGQGVTPASGMAPSTVVMDRCDKVIVYVLFGGGAMEPP
ncbi:hypothetical protein Dimus_024713 [Dionaea muscipula]